MTRFKVLFLTPWFPVKENPAWGVFVREYAKAAQLYDDVIVLHLAGHDPSLARLWKMEEVQDIELTEGIRTYRVWHGALGIPRSSYLVYLWSAFKAFRRIAQDGFRPDILHTHVYTTAMPAVLLGKMYRIPVVMSEHSTAFPRKLLSPKEIRRVRFAFKRAKKVLPVSHALREAIEALGVRASFQIVPNVVDPTLFHPPLDTRDGHDVRRILFVGLLGAHDNKGLPYLFEALVHLQDKSINYHLDIIGDGPSRVRYESLVAQLGLVERVTFHGFKSKLEVAGLMRTADLFVFPSVYETFGVAAAEALASGVPVLSTHCGGTEEFITNDVGVLVDAANPDALYEGLIDMLDHLNRFSPAHISCYARERFSPERVGAQLNAIYESCLVKK